MNDVISIFDFLDVDEKQKGSNLISLSEFCDELSISTATGRNWIKLKKITPTTIEGKSMLFTKEYTEKLKNKILVGEVSALKSRRNKKYVSGFSLYKSYVSENCKNLNTIDSLIDDIESNNINMNDALLKLLLADCAIKMIISKNNLSVLYNNCDILLEYIDGNLVIGNVSKLIDDLIEHNKDMAREIIINNKNLFDKLYLFEKKEDVLGLIYISLRNIGNRKATGSYYTPTKIVKRLIEDLEIIKDNNKIILDPCCGTGNFILQLPDEYDFDFVFANEIDKLSAILTRINVYLNFENVSMEQIYSHITNKNFITEYEKSGIDCIIGNPPWGYEFTDEECVFLRSNYSSAVGNSIESFNICIEKSLRLLNKKGVLSFVLPEAILNVKAHAPIRRILLTNNRIKKVDFLGNAFDNVQCPSIIMQIEHTGNKMTYVGTTVTDSNNTFVINKERNISDEIFNFKLNDEQYLVLMKLLKHDNSVYLLNNADFALGIVTGNNNKYLSNSKNEDNEPVLKGNDIVKYKFKAPKNFIEFVPSEFQQVAPVEYYRADEKLLYRFISSQLVFAYDKAKTLSLNSCNILIPKIEGINIKYVLAILNSRISQYIYKMYFNSIKVLRSHIERIPIPRITIDKQKDYIDLVNCLIEEKSVDEIEKLYNLLDDKIRQLYLLTDDDYTIVKNIVDVDNKFLY